MEKESKQEKEFTVRIGPLLRKALDDQKEQIREVTYDVCQTSDFEVGEIIAKKYFKMV